MTLKPRTSTSPGISGRQAVRASTTRTSVPGSPGPEVVAIGLGGSSPRRHIVTVPHDSVSPYAVRTVSKLSSSRIRSTRTSGTIAAPVTTTRSAVRS